MSDETESVRAHKLFVFERGGFVNIEMVNDERPHVRMELALLTSEARDIAAALVDAAEGIEATP